LKKHRRLIAIAFGLTVLGALLVGGFTAAAFTSTTVSGENAFNSGRMEVRLDRDNGSHYFDLANIAPGDSGSTEVVVTNAGSVDFDYHMLIDLDGKLTSGSAPLTVTVFDSQGNLVASEEVRRLAAGTQEVLTLVWEMPATAGNEYQGAAAQMDLSVLAEQITG
jgi:predicted ribosomally synthesized peptide with SipW-like signal peptide